MNKLTGRYLIVIFILLTLIAGVTRGRGGIKQLKQNEFLMDTIVNGTIYITDTGKGKEALNLAYEEMSRLEALLDRHQITSEVSRINEAAGIEPVKVSAHTLNVISGALQIAEETGGAFDITIAPLMIAWGFATDQEKVPEAGRLEEARQLVDFRQVEIDRENSTVFLKKKGTSLDLGGIAKGYIVDRAVNVLSQQDISAASVDAGGDIRVMGRKPDGTPWRIGVRNPRERRELAAIVEIDDGAIVTSGDYERFFFADNQRYHHILDPRTGFPARGLSSVTVVAADAFTADAYSTALFVLGPEKGMALVEKRPNLEAFMITEEGEIHVSAGLEGKVTLQ